MAAPESDAILLLGLGELGLPILRYLRALPSPPAVTVLLRPGSSSAAQATAHRAPVVEADIASASQAELAALFARFGTVVGCTGMAFPAGTQLKLARAALSGGVPRYVPWQFGVDYDAKAGASAQDLFAEQLEVRRLLRAQARTEWVVISVGMFMEFLFWPGFGVVDLEQPAVRCLGAWDARLTVTCVEDIGRVTALALAARGADRVANEVVWVAGDTVSYAKLAEIVERVTGKAVERRDGSMEVLRRELAEKPDDGLCKYRAAFAEGVGVSWDKEQTWNARHGVAVTDLETWARARGAGGA